MKRKPTGATTPSKLPNKRKSLGASHSSFAAPSWGKGDGKEQSRIRVVVRIRPDERSEGEDHIVFPYRTETVEKDVTSTVATSPNTGSQYSSSVGVESSLTSPSVTSLAAKFEESSMMSPSFIPIPGEITTPSKRINNYVNGNGASASKTPLHKNSIARPSSIPIPGVITTPTKFTRRSSDNLKSPMNKCVSPITTSSRPSFIQSSTMHSSPHGNSVEDMDDGANVSTQKIMVGKKYPKEFEFDEVIDATSSQQEVYERAIGDAVRRNIFRGINTSVLTYGQANSGKTYTMNGKVIRKRNHVRSEKRALTSKLPPGALQMRPMSARENSDDFSIDDTSILSRESTTCTQHDGIIFRAINDVFMAKKRHATGGDVIVNMSYFEVCGNDVKDLLGQKKNRLSQPSKIRDRKDNGISFAGGLTSISSVNIKSSSQAKYMIDVASRSRKMKPYERAHIICIIKVTINPAVNSSVTSGKHITATDTIVAKLTLCDLAGSERTRGDMSVAMSRSLVKVKKDLFTLGSCIAALSDNSKKGISQHVPWRDCKLTRIMKDSLCGNCCTVMIACISPLTSNIEDTLNTLRYAERTKHITNNISKNVRPTLALSPRSGAALRRENKVLTVKVLELTRKIQFMRKYQHWEDRAINHRDYDGDSINSGELSLSSSLNRRLNALEESKWRVKFEKLSKICHQKGIHIPDSDLDISDKQSTFSFDSELRELKEQVQQLLSGYDTDDASILSGLTTLTDDFVTDDNDDGSICSSSTTSTFSLTYPGEDCKPIDDVGGADSLDDCIEEKLKQVIHLEKKLNDLKESNQKESTSHEIRIEKLKTESTKAQDEVSKLKNQVQYLIDKKHSLVEEVECLQDLTSLAAELSLEQERCEEKDRELITSKKEIRSLKENRDSLQRKINQFQLDAQREVKKRESFEATLKGLRLRVEEMESNKIVQAAEIKRYESLKPPLPKSRSRPMSRQDDKTAVSSISISGFYARNDDASNYGMSTDQSFVSYATDAESLNTDQLAIRSHAQKLLAWAERSERQSRENSFSSSLHSVSTPCCIPVHEQHDASAIRTTSLDKENSNPNVKPTLTMGNNKEYLGTIKKCTCGTSIFSRKDEHSEFFLPKLGLACSCGAETAEMNYADPGSLTCYLRPWQVAFLSSVGITTTTDLVNGQRYNSKQLTKEMKSWRRSKSMKPARTKSCNIALHIWSKTAATAIQTNERKSLYEESKPISMEIDCGRDDDDISFNSVSTIGNYSAVRQMNMIGTEDPLDDGEFEI